MRKKAKKQKAKRSKKKWRQIAPIPIAWNKANLSAYPRTGLQALSLYAGDCALQLFDLLSRSFHAGQNCLAVWIAGHTIQREVGLFDHGYIPRKPAKLWHPNTRFSSRHRQHSRHKPQIDCGTKSGSSFCRTISRPSACPQV